MTHFEKQIVGLAERLIAGTDCGALHGGNWRLPCPICIETERKTGDMLRVSINEELVRRHVAAGHDERDGNRPVRRASVKGSKEK